MTTFADLSAPLALLRLLAADHPDLPAVNVLISRRSPNRLNLEVHGDLTVFEAWRDALGIDPESVRRNLHSADTAMVLTGHATVADCKIELVAYAPNLSLLAEAAA
ncbi:hypothetical protein [Streptomyces sp. MZ04]|uniref:hypothetical protein n=1 Tax=Streptomyces sp. MZ04 TaxID=2559236 RepID=UPI00107ED3EF|nr:hypothetical protein [Streptomyces sp. MZ04]TGB11595.1 hypothetical protein E2651_13020 [Streptomyces sp. MZ04]